MDGFDDEVSPAESARERRRDRDSEAGARAGMRTGLAKQFKQVLDTQTRRAQESERPAGERGKKQTGFEDEPMDPTRPPGKRKR